MRMDCNLVWRLADHCSSSLKTSGSAAIKLKNQTGVIHRIEIL